MRYNLYQLIKNTKETNPPSHEVGHRESIRQGAIGGQGARYGGQEEGTGNKAWGQ